MTCQNCNSEFTALRKWQKFCSAKCRIAAYEERTGKFLVRIGSQRFKEMHSTTHSMPPATPRKKKATIRLRTLCWRENGRFSFEGQGSACVRVDEAGIVRKFEIV